MSLTKVSYSMIEGAVGNILDYGAVMDDSSAGVRTANRAAYLAAVADGIRHLFIPQGTLWIDGDIEHGGIVVQGAGKGYTIIKGDGDLFKQSAGGGAGGFFDFAIENDSVRGKLFKFTGGVDSALPVFERVYFNTAEYHVHAPGGAIVGFYMNQCTFLDANVTSRYFQSLWAYEESDCYTWYCNRGLHVEGTASTCSIRGSVYEQIQQEAIRLENVSSTEISAFNIIGVHFEINGKAGAPDVYLATTGPGRVRSVNFIGCGFFSPDAATTPARIQKVAGGGGNVADINVKGNSFLGGVLAVSPDDLGFVLDNNYFAGSPNTANLSATKTLVSVPWSQNNWMGSYTACGNLDGNGVVQVSVAPPSGCRFAKVYAYGNTYNGTTPGTNDAYLEGAVIVAAASTKTFVDLDSTLGGSNQGAVLEWSAGNIVIKNKTGMSNQQSLCVTIDFYS